jgi:hypothetical protein
MLNAYWTSVFIGCIVGDFVEDDVTAALLVSGELAVVSGVVLGSSC